MLQAERALCAGPALRRSVAWSEMQCGCTHMHGSDGATQAEVRLSGGHVPENNGSIEEFYVTV